MDQGWKLHISATAPASVDVLQKFLPYAAERGLPHKVAKDLKTIKKLNAGVETPYSQIGKLITVYTGDDGRQTRQVADDLAHLLAQTPHPDVPYDLRFSQAAPIFYRYGSYSGTELRSPIGALYTDLREYGAAVPTWVENTVARPILKRSPLPDLNILVVRLLARRGRGYTAEAIDLNTGQNVILKHGRKYGEADHFGLDGAARLENEVSLLDFASRSGCNVAQVETHHIIDSDQYARINYINGVNVASLLASAEFTQISQLERLRLASSVAQLVASLHAARIIWGDIKPSNLMLNKDGAPVAVDLEGAGRFDDPPLPWGSPGYIPPCRSEGVHLVSPTDDYYALGVCLTQILIGLSKPPTLDEGRKELHKYPSHFSDAVIELMSNDAGIRAEGFQALINII